MSLNQNLHKCIFAGNRSYRNSCASVTAQCLCQAAFLVSLSITVLHYRQRMASASQNIGVLFSLKRKAFGQCFQKRYPLIFHAFSQIPWNIAMNHSFGGRGEREGNILLLLTIPKKNYFGLGSYCSYFMEQKEHFHMDFYKIDKGLYYKKINAGSSKR